MPRHVLITGGAGFIGGHLGAALAARGDVVVALDNLSTGLRSNVSPGVELVLGDARDPELVDRLVDRADIVYHLASAVGVRLVVSQPVETIENSVGCASVVLKAAAAHGVRFVLASSSEVYGKRSAGLFAETDDIQLGAPTRPRWAYACSKALDEWLAMAWHAQVGLPVVIARLFNTVGPRQRADFGMVLPSFVLKARAGEPLLVHGDGSQTRTFTHVADCVEGLLRLGDDLSIDGEIVNVGGFEELSMLALAHRVVAATGSDSPVRLLPYDEAFGPDFEDMLRRVPDVGKLKRLTGFVPRYDIDRIIADVLAQTD